MNNSKALDTIKQGGNPLAQLAEFQTQQYNILAPIDWSGQIPAGTRLSLRVEHIDVGADTYSTEGGRRALRGHALDRLSAASGVSYPSVERTDGRIHPHFVEFTVTARVIDGDGLMREGRGTRAIDLRADIGDGTPGADLEEILQSAKAKDRSPDKQIMKARQFIVPMCESKAKNRATRHLLSIKPGYQPGELQKPFVAVKLVVDTADATAKTMVLAQMTGATQALYGGQAAPAPAPIEAQIIDADLASNSADQVDQSPAGDEAPPAGDQRGGAPGGHPAAGAPPPASPADRLRAVYEGYCQLGGTAGRFQELVRRETGLVDVTAVTHEQIDQVERAITAALAGSAEDAGGAQ